MGKNLRVIILTRMKRDRDKLQEQMETLQGDIEEMEHVHAEELSDQQERFDAEIDKRIGKEKKEIKDKAIAKSRAGQLGKTLEKVAPMFPGFGHHPYDVRPIFDPIDFVIFDGYFKGEVTDPVFVEFKTGQSRLNDVQNSIREAVRKQRVHFEEKRLSSQSIKMLTDARQSNRGGPNKVFVENVPVTCASPGVAPNPPRETLERGVGLGIRTWPGAANLAHFAGERPEQRSPPCNRPHRRQIPRPALSRLDARGRFGVGAKRARG